MFAGYLVIQCETFPTFVTKALALLVLLLTSPSSQVWLNTINSQFYLAVCATIIFLSRADRRQLQRNLTLAVAGLTGPVTTFLTPFFWFRALREKTAEAYLQAGVLTACALTQIVIVREFLHAGARRISFQPSGIAPGFLVEYLTMPFFGRVAKRIAGSVILQRRLPYRVTGHTMAAHWKAAILSFHLPLTWPYLLLWVAIDIAFIGLLLWITFDRLDRSSWWLLAMSLWLAIFSIYGAVGGTYAVAERYVFPSAVLMGLALLLASVRPTGRRAARIAARCLLAVFLLSGAHDFLSYPTWLGYERPAGPGWRLQISEWEKNPDRKLTVWPTGFGSLRLSPDHRPTLPGKDAETPTRAQ